MFHNVSTVNTLLYDENLDHQRMVKKINWALKFRTNRVLSHFTTQLCYLMFTESNL